MTQAFPAISSQSAVVATFNQFRSKLPTQINADVLQQLDLAPKNESFIINIFKFLGIIDDEGKVISENSDFFFSADDEFKEGLQKRVRDSYSELFDLYGDDAWTADTSKLVAFFRKRDSATELVGSRKAKTYETLAGLAGKRDPSPPAPTQKNPSTARNRKPKSGTKSAAQKTVKPHNDNTRHSDMQLAVKIEINLPATTDEKVYQAIFKSLRADLIDG